MKIKLEKIVEFIGLIFIVSLFISMIIGFVDMAIHDTKNFIIAISIISGTYFILSLSNKTPKKFEHDETIEHFFIMILCIIFTGLFVYVDYIIILRLFY